MSPIEARRVTTLRWGGTIALLLAVQSLLMAGLFWALATGGHRRELDRELADDCARFAALTRRERPVEVQRTVARDIHRDRFLALFDRRGHVTAGNVAHMPGAASAMNTSIVADVEPTDLPGKTLDQARLRVCPMPGGDRLLTGFDLDDTDATARTVGRALLMGLLPGIVFAVGFGLAAARRAGRQVDTVRRLSEGVMAGNFQGRITVADRPDSFDLLCAHINAMLDRIEVLMTDVRAVGDDIAHQIRTPLTRLRARIEREMEAARSPEAFRATAAAALVDIDGTLGIVAALLRIRELEDHARRSRFATVDLARLIDDAAELHAPNAEDRGVTLTSRIEYPTSVVGDVDLLMEAVSNLIENAVKFGPSGGQVELILMRAGGSPTIAVTDEGAGVSAADRHLVTQRFYRGHRDTPGSGLGLSLVKAIADLHGAHLRFRQRGADATSAAMIAFDRSHVDGED